MEQEIKDLLLHRETFYRSNEDGGFSRVDMLNEFYEDIKNFLKQEIEKAYERGRREIFTKEELFMLKLAMNDIFNSGNSAYEGITKKIVRLMRDSN